MLHIAICDDDETVVKEIARFIEIYGTKNGIDLRACTFDSGTAMLSFHKKYDLIFLDIEMRGMNGIDTAVNIRKIDMNVPIVYVTGYPDYWKRAYKVHAFDFIPKPFDYDDIAGVLDDFLLSRMDSQSRSVSLETEDGNVVLNMNEIISIFIYAKRCVKITTAYGRHTTKEPLSSIMEKLDHDMFYRTNKDCIVNLKYVQTVLKDNGILLTDGTWAPLAQKKQKEFNEKLSEQLRRI